MHHKRPVVPIRKALIEARERAGLSRSELAREVGIHLSTVMGIEDGYRQPSFGLMVRWCKALGVSLDAWGLDEPRRNKPKRPTFSEWMNEPDIDDVA